jgi:hypothetical protein
MLMAIRPVPSKASCFRLLLFFVGETLTSRKIDRRWGPQPTTILKTLWWRFVRVGCRIGSTLLTLHLQFSWLQYTHLYTQLIPLYSKKKVVYMQQTVFDFASLRIAINNSTVNQTMPYSSVCFSTCRCWPVFFVRKHQKKLAYPLVINHGDPIKTSI